MSLISVELRFATSPASATCPGAAAPSKPPIPCPPTLIPPRAPPSANRAARPRPLLRPPNPPGRLLPQTSRRNHQDLRQNRLPDGQSLSQTCAKATGIGSKSCSKSGQFCLAFEREAPVSDSMPRAQGRIANSVAESCCFRQLRAGPALRGLFATMSRL
jgi:hypothetical protein